MATVAKNTRSTTSTVAVSTAGPFSVGFRLFDDDALNVYVNDVQRADFTITSNYVNGYDDNAEITFDSALSISDALRIEGWLSPGRAEDLVNGDGDLVAKMNVELARIWSSLIEVQREAARSLRSFTEMAPAAGIDLEAIVGAEAFALAAAASASAASTSAAAALAAENSLLEWQGAWVTATAYAPSDLVQESGNTYACVTAHTSGTFATDLGAGLWELFAAKGAAGAGSGDVLAANNGSDFASDVSVRTNLKVPGRLTASVGTNDFDSDYDSRETSMFLVPASPLNGPAGGAAGDWVSWFRTDSNNIRAIWHLNDGSFATRTKVSGTWGDWISHPTDADLQAATPVAKVLFDGTVSPPTILYSKGISSVVRTATGQYTVTWANALTSSNAMVHVTSNSHSCRPGSSRTTTSVNIINEDKNGTNENASFISVTIEGTLA